MLVEIYMFLHELQGRLHGSPEVGLYYREEKLYMQVLWYKPYLVYRYEFNKIDVLKLDKETHPQYIDYLVMLVNQAYDVKRNS